MNYRIEQLRYQLREDPSSRVFNQLADLLRREGEAEEAAAILRRGLEVHPRYAAAWVALGRALTDLQDPEGAVEAFSRAHRLDAGNLVAARAVAQAALADQRWSEAATMLRELRDAIPGDDEVVTMLAGAEEKLAEQEAAALEAVAAQAIPLPRPPAEVISLSGDDPFADEGGEFDDEASAAQDVFAVEDRPEAELELAAEEPFDVLSTVGGDDDAVDDSAPLASDEGEVGPMTDGPFGLAGREGDDDADAEPNFESWADVEDDESFGELRVEPPPQIDSDLPDEEGLPVEEVVIAAEAEPGLPVPEIAEPDLDPMAAAPEAPGFESWADVDDDDNDDHVVQPTAEVAEAITLEPEPEPEPEPQPESDLAAEVAEEMVIPEAIAHFDRGPADDEDDEDDEIAPVTAGDVPLPTLTLAKLALEQGDEGLAVATLERLIAKDPSNAAAIEMLHGLRSGGSEDSIDVTGAKVAALRGWLDTIRLASERRQT